MSIGAGATLFGKAFDFYIGKKKYTTSLNIVKLSIVSAGGGGFTLLSMDIGAGIRVGKIATPSFTLLSFHIALRW